MTIPQIIHQTYKNKELPQIYAMCQKEIRRLHPDFEYRFYTDEDIDSFIKKDFPEYYKRFNELPRMIMKIDMFRYFLMYKYGGIYADLDYLMLRPFDLDMTDKEVIIPTNRDFDKNGSTTSLGNCIFASAPGHPFWKLLIDSLFTIDRKNLPSKGFNDVIYSTGPMFVFNKYMEFNRKEDIYVPPRNYFHPPTKRDEEYINELRNKGCFGFHLCTGVWLNNSL